MANPWLNFVGQDEEEEERETNPWLAFTPEKPSSPEDILQSMRERYPDAMPGLAGEEPEGTGLTRPLQHEVAAQIGTRIKRGIVGLGELPELALRASSGAQGMMNRALLPEGLERRVERDREMNTDVVAGMMDTLAPDPLQRWAEDVREEYDQAKERTAEIGEQFGAPPWLTATADTALEGAAVVGDPTNFVPVGAAVKGVRGLGRVARAAGEVAPVARAVGEAVDLSATAAPRVISDEAVTNALATGRRIAEQRRQFPDLPRSFGTAPEGLDQAVAEAERIYLARQANPGIPDRLLFGEDAVERVRRAMGGAPAEKSPYAGTADPLREVAETLVDGPKVHVPAGERGHVVVRVGAPEGTATFFQRWFTNWGDYAAMGKELGPVTAEAKRLTGSAIKTEGKRAEMLVRDAALEIKRHHKALPGNRPLDETLDYVLSGLEGEHAFDGAETLGQRMAAARQHLDNLSRDFEGELQKLLDEDLIKSPEWKARAKDLRTTIRGNMGQWTRRSFEAFRNADWADLVKAADSPERWRWDNFTDWAKREISKSEPGLADDVLQARAEGLGNKYLRRDPEVFLGFGERTLIPTERLGSARARLNLPEQIDDLLGLDKDPLVRYRESVLSLAHDIESLKFKRRLLQEGDGKIFFDQPMGNFSEQVRGASGLDPLAGRYTSPEIHAVIAAATDGARDAATLLAKTSSLVKAGKTVFSPAVTHPRNLFSWIPMITANGHTVKAWNPRRWARSAATVASGKIAKGGKLERGIDALARHIQLADGRRLSDVKDYTALEYLRERLLRLQKAGVVGESATAGDAAHFLGVAGEVKSLSALKDTRLAKGTGKFARAMEWMYGAEDDLGKMVAFDALEEDLLWAMKGTDPDEVFAETARRIRDTTPTYSKIAPATRKLRDNPLISAFPTFTQEVYRNFKNGAKIALTDLRSPNPRMRILGAKRIGGLVTAAGAPAALAAAGSYATGISEEGVDALREFVAPWDRSARLAPIQVDGYKIQTANLSYMMPHAIFGEPLIAASLQLSQDEGEVEDVVEATMSAAWEAGEPFLSREILIDGVLDFAWKTRGEFWDTKKPVDVNARAIANALWRTVTPGGLLWIERVAKAAGVGEALEEQAATMPPEEPSQETIEFVASLLQQVNDYGKEYRLGEEILAGGTGIRRMTYDVYEGLGFKASAFKRNYSDASYRNNRAKGHPGRLPPGVVLERRRESNEQFRKGWEELHRAVEAMRKIGEESGKDRGMVDRDIRRKLNEEKLGQRWINSIMDGNYEDPY